MKYKIVSSDSLHELTNTINHMLRQGWKPIGGVSSFAKEYNNGTQISFIQALIMVKNKKV
jgi:hypothetical protein